MAAGRRSETSDSGTSAPPLCEPFATALRRA